MSVERVECLTLRISASSLNTLMLVWHIKQKQLATLVCKDSLCKTRENHVQLKVPLFCPSLAALNIQKIWMLVKPVWKTLETWMADAHWVSLTANSIISLSVCAAVPIIPYSLGNASIITFLDVKSKLLITLAESALNLFCSKMHIVIFRIAGRWMTLDAQLVSVGST